MQPGEGSAQIFSTGDRVTREYHRVTVTFYPQHWRYLADRAGREGLSIPALVRQIVYLDSKRGPFPRGNDD